MQPQHVEFKEVWKTYCCSTITEALKLKPTSKRHRRKICAHRKNTIFPDMHSSWHIQDIKQHKSVSEWIFSLTHVLKMCVYFTSWCVCVQGLSLSHIITASCCFSSLLWPAPVRLLNRVSSPLKTWATLVPPSKTLRGTTLLLFIHSALKTRSDPLTPNTDSRSSDRWFHT